MSTPAILRPRLAPPSRSSPLECCATLTRLGVVADRRCRLRRNTKDNDPHHEHDFGNFELDGVTYFFKLDYYTPDMEGGSEDPADPAKTTRVLTIMRADEY